MSMYCRITGKSRGLPKPNYFPLLPPISPADAKKLCRITGKTHGLPASHHYIPIPLVPKKKSEKCPVTGKSIGQPQHHFIPELTAHTAELRHQPISGYRYVVPVLDQPPPPLQDLLNSDVLPDSIAAQYVYTLEEQSCGIVLPANIEAAVREGKVSGMLISDGNDKVALKLLEGKQVTLKVLEMKPQNVNNNEPSNKEVLPLLDGQGPSKKALEKKKKIAEAKAKKKENDIELKKIFEEKENKAEKEELASVFEKKPKPVKKEAVVNVEPVIDIPLTNGHDEQPVPKEKVDEVVKPDTKIIKKVVQGNSNGTILQPYIVPYDDLSKLEINPEEKVAPLPDPINIPQSAEISIAACDPGIVDTPKKLVKATISLPPTTCLIPSMPSRNQLDTSVLKSIWDIAKRDQQTLEKTANAVNVLTPEHLDKVATLQDILKLTKNLEKGVEVELKWGNDVLHGKNVPISKDKSCFVPGLEVNGKFIPGQTIDNQFIAGLTVKTAHKVGLIPGCVMKEEEFVAGINREGKFIPGQIFNIGEKEEFVPGQTVMTPDGPRFIPGQTVNNKFIPGIIVETENGPQFVHGQSPTSGDFKPGQICKNALTGEPIFVSGQTIIENGEHKFIPGQTINTPNGPKFIPGLENNDAIKTFIPGISDNNEFIPGTILSTPKGEKFIEGRVLVDPEGRSRFVAGKKEVDDFKIAKDEKDIKARPYKEKKAPYKQKKNVVYGHMIQMESGVQFYPEGNSLPTIGVTRSIPGQLVKNIEDSEEPRFVPGMIIEGSFVAGQMVRTIEGTKFVPGQLVKTKDGAKFVPGQTLDDGQFVPGQVVDDKFVPGQIVQTAAGPTFIPGQVISTPEEGARFVPGRVVETSEGPRFAPGRVMEDANGGVSFIPGRVVETEQGPHFIAPDLESTPDGNIQFSMQSFEVSPEELQLLDQANINMEDTENVDSKMLEQLAKAGITLAQKSLPDVYICPIKNLQEIATHITERLKLPAESQDKMALVLQKVAELGHNISIAKTAHQNIKVDKPSMKSEFQMQAYELIESAIKAAITTASKDISLNPDEAIINEMSTVLEDALPQQKRPGNEPYPEVLLTALFEVVSSEATLEAISSSVQQGLKKPTANKVEVLKDIINNTENVQETVARIGKVLRRPKSSLDIGKAFKRLSVGDPELVDLVVSKVGEKVSNINTEKEAAQTLQNSIVSAVRECSEREIFDILDSTDQSGLKHLILQAVALARALGLNAAAEELLILLQDSRIASALATDQTALEILQRLTLMKKLSESRPAYAKAMGNLNSMIYKDDTRYLKQLVRESEALLTSVREEDDSFASDDDSYTYSNSSFNSTFDDEIIARVPRRISSSKDIPQALFHALVDCQKPMQLLRRLLRASQPEYQYSYDHACVILKNKIQAVIPKESAKSVLTGKASYTLIDEKGVSRFDAMDVFSAMKIDKPIALSKFSLYSAGLESTWAYAKEIQPEIFDDGYGAAGTSHYDTTQGTITPLSTSLSDEVFDEVKEVNNKEIIIDDTEVQNKKSVKESKTKRKSSSKNTTSENKVIENGEIQQNLNLEKTNLVENSEKADGKVNTSQTVDVCNKKSIQENTDLKLDISNGNISETNKLLDAEKPETHEQVTPSDINGKHDAESVKTKVIRKKSSKDSESKTGNSTIKTEENKTSSIKNADKVLSQTISNIAEVNEKIALENSSAVNATNSEKPEEQPKTLLEPTAITLNKSQEKLEENVKNKTLKACHTSTDDTEKPRHHSKTGEFEEKSVPESSQNNTHGSLQDNTKVKTTKTEENKTSSIKNADKVLSQTISNIAEVNEKIALENSSAVNATNSEKPEEQPKTLLEPTAITLNKSQEKVEENVKNKTLKACHTSTEDAEKPRHHSKTGEFEEKSVPESSQNNTHGLLLDTTKVKTTSTPKKSKLDSKNTPVKTEVTETSKPEPSNTNNASEKLTEEPKKCNKISAGTDDVHKTSEKPKEVIKNKP